MTPGIALKQGLEIGYKNTIATVSEDAQLGEGTHYLLARNGRGKTTLLRSLASALPLKSGSFNIQGNIQFIPEDIYYNQFLTPLAILKCLLPKQNLEDCLAFADKIELEIKKEYRELSTGNKRKVSWLMAEFSCSTNKGDVLLLDEPFTGVDAHVRQAFMEYWEQNNTGVCRLVSCHPDFDSMPIDSAVIISKKTIIVRQDALSWKNLKGDLV